MSLIEQFIARTEQAWIMSSEYLGQLAMMIIIEWVEKNCKAKRMTKAEKNYLLTQIVPTHLGRVVSIDKHERFHD